MKILMVVGSYLPTKTGGIENYTHWLAAVLVGQGHVVQIAYLNLGASDSYQHEGIPISRIMNGLPGFEKMLEEGNFDICHFQEYSGTHGIHIRWFESAKQRCKKVYFTFHLPYLTCYKGDFRYNGLEDCSIFTSTERCIRCVISTRLNRKPATSFPVYNWGADILSLLIRNSRAGHRLNRQIKAGQQDLLRLVATCDQIFIYANWFKKLLAENGYEAPSIVKIPYITKPFTQRQEQGLTIKKKLLFVGRIETQKGLHLLTKAMGRIKTTGITLDVFGNIVDQAYFNECRALHAFNYRGTLNRPELLQLLSTYDFLVLPSVFPEMFPMIIKEAFYEELPVIASTSKGNKDAVVHGKSGFLFRYDDYQDLVSVIDRAYAELEGNWKPSFDIPQAAHQDIQEIMSFYQ